jgi:drug/metabolite transporter (DMT)-like permease
MCLVWGATWIAVKVGIAVVPPSLFAGTRFIAAGSILLCVSYAQGELRTIPRSDLPRFAAITLLLIDGVDAPDGLSVPKWRC